MIFERLWRGRIDMDKPGEYKVKEVSAYPRFGLTLMVTHACNLRCTYCYNGPQYDLSMSGKVGRKAIDRSIGSIQEGGILELVFFGGEPLLEADLISLLADYARNGTQRAGLRLYMAVTTNGTITNRQAWAIMMMSGVDVALSIDGPPEIHDRNRFFANGKGSCETVLKTIGQLLDAGKDIKAVTVLRPDSVHTLADVIMYLQGLGISRVELALDIWTRWDSESTENLERAIVQCGRLWAKGLPNLSINWFDDKAAMLTRKIKPSLGRCGFGRGDIAVSAAGYLYPCERLIGDDRQTNRLRLPGNVFGGEDFLLGSVKETRTAESCRQCAIQSACSTTCACCNYVRTGDTGKPDALLCLFNQWCLRETKCALEKSIVF
jgi:uncharacterized protein